MSGGIAVVPQYMGSDKLRVMPALSAEYRNANGFFASSTRGLGYTRALGPLTRSGALAYDAGRSDKKDHVRSGSDALKGMGKIEGAAIASLSAAYDFGPVQVQAGTEQALTGTYRSGRQLESRDQQDMVAAIDGGPGPPGRRRGKECAHGAQDQPGLDACRQLQVLLT